MRADFERARVREGLRAELFGKDAAPAKLGRFEVLERIGSGASSHVYAGRDPDLDRRVAIKVLHPGRHPEGVTEDMRQRMVREGRALAKLSHPNVLQVFEIGADGDNVFLAVELVDGRDLAEWLAVGPRAWSEVVEVMAAAGAGLAAAHTVGLVHRDMKPANVLVDAEGHVRVADFGLVQPFGRAEATDGEGGGSAFDLTRTGALVGSPAYMAKEQWLGGEVDARTDQFGFCVTFYEALHGERPFVGRTEEELATAVLKGPMAGRGADSVPAWLDAIVRRGLLPDPADRFPTMTALLAELERGATSHESLVAAQRELAQLCGSMDAATFADHASAARVSFASVLEASPNDEAARRGRAQLLEHWFDHDLLHGALEAAAARLAELGDARPELEARLAHARESAAQKEQDLEKLAAMERDEDPNVALAFKVRATASQIPVWVLVFWGLGAANRAGVLEVGARELCLAFGLYMLVNLVVTRLWSEKWFPNLATQRIVELVAMNLGGTSLMLGFAWWMGMPSSQALVFVQVMLATFWCGAGLFIDRRLLLIALAALFGAVAMRLWPAYAIDAYGAVTGVALGLVVWRWLADAPTATDGGEEPS